MKTRHARRNLALALVLVVLSAACGSSRGTPILGATPSGSPSGVPTGALPGSPGSSPSVLTEEQIYEQIETQVEQLRALLPKTAVHPVLLNEAGVRSWMEKSMEGVDHKALAAQSRLFAHLGLLPAGASIEQLELDLNASQAIGFYDPESKQLYLLSQSGSVDPEVRLTFSHEFTHALQDQNFDLGKLVTDAVDQTDRDLARLALAEGDATLSMTQWAQAHMSLGDLLSISLNASSGPQAKQLEAAPAILRADLLFPYEDGLNFITGVYSQGGWSAVNKLYANPPSSTSQILHPDLYARGVGPTVVTLPPPPSAMGSGWLMTSSDTMGELQLRVWLEGSKPSSAQHKAAASAVSTWAGDRVGLYEGPGGAWAVVLRTEWRTAAGRNAFAAAANARLEGIVGQSTICGDATHADLVIASESVSMAALQTCNAMD